jgi:hypothetical protein
MAKQRVSKKNSKETSKEERPSAIYISLSGDKVISVEEWEREWHQWYKRQRTAQ